VNRILEGWDLALRHGGWWVALGIIIGVLLVGSLVQPHKSPPGKAFSDEVLEPIGRVFGVVSTTCPSGWQDHSERDEHQRVLQCIRGDWRVVLWPDGSFNYALRERPELGFEFDPANVPGWPQ
jgi:hypothetical protein